MLVLPSVIPLSRYSDHQLFISADRAGLRPAFFVPLAPAAAATAAVWLRSPALGGAISIAMDDGLSDLDRITIGNHSSLRKRF